MNKIQQVAKFYDARDSLEGIHGELYPAKVKPYVKMLEKHMERNKTAGVLDAFLALSALHVKVNSATLLWLMAAVVEILEPFCVEDEKPAGEIS